MTALRQKMIDAMRVRGFSVRTHQSYLSAVGELAGYYKRSPETLSVEELQAFFAYLAIERELSGATCRLYLNAVRFFYLQVLGWPSFDVPMTVPKKAQRIPELLTRTEVGRILSCCVNPKHRMLLTTCYGCGLRVSEVVSLQVRHIDGERQLLRVEQGKGAKDRLVVVSEALLDALRRYWRLYHPTLWLFPGSRPDVALSISSAQRVYQRARAQAGVGKVGGIHSLRHAYATHQLEAGLPVHRLQRLLGHQNLRSTLRYVHWVPERRAGHTRHGDLIAALETPR
jgi:site-specific recombinase XerD